MRINATFWKPHEWFKCSPSEVETQDWTEGLKLSCRRQAELQAVCSWITDLAPWQVMFTGTFAYQASVWSAEKSYLRFMDKNFPKVSDYYACERHPRGHGFHVHAVWALPTEIFRSGAWELWHKKYGRALVEPVRSRVDVSNYIAKYLLKTDDSHAGPRFKDPMLFKCAQEGVPGVFSEKALLDLRPLAPRPRVVGAGTGNAPAPFSPR